MTSKWLGLCYTQGSAAQASWGAAASGDTAEGRKPIHLCRMTDFIE